MSLNPAAQPWRQCAVVRSLLLCVSVLGLAACSNNSNRGISDTLGVGTGVTITTSGGLTEIQQGTTLQVYATVVSDVNNAGVTWSVTGTLPDGVTPSGTLTANTTSTVTFNAATGVTGAVSAQITATSNANNANVATVTIIVLGSAQLTQNPMFPGNVNVPYAASISVAGGEAPYTWALTNAAGDSIPPGLTFNGSSIAETTVTGTPTTAGTYSFHVQVTDALGTVATLSTPFVITINPAASCLLIGRFTFMFSGFRGGGGATHAGSIAIDSSGNITGEQDYKDGNRTTPAEAITSGTCTNRATNTGVIRMNAASGTLTYNFAVTAPDSSGVIHSARLQLISSGADSGSGELSLLDTTALGSTPPTGNFAFGLVATNTNQPNMVHFGSVGRFTTDSTGTLSLGAVDSNSPVTPLTNAALTGALSAPDANGRGTLTLTAGSVNSTLAYYVVNASKMYLIDIDAQAAATNNLRESGYLTAQVGDVSGGSFDASAFAAPSILSLFSAATTVEPINIMTLGRLSNASASAGTLNAVLDTSDHLVNTAALAYTAQPYTVATNGRGTLALTGSTSTIASRSFVFYLDGTSNGYILEPSSEGGAVGLLEQQFVPTNGVYSDSLTGYFVGGTQFATAPGPIDLIPLVSFQFGALASSYTNGQFSLDPNTGRGLGTLSETGVGTADAALYEVSPNKFEVLRYSTRAVDSTIEWFLLQ